MQNILGGTPAGDGGIPSAAAMVKEGSAATFAADVLDASLDVPVIVDFWAPWCGPCKQLGPALERAVTERAGAVRMVKINIDENPEIAQQLRIQSIPAVYAFARGQPVDGFVGALPESQVKSFVERVIRRAGGQGGPSAVEQALEAAAQALEQGDASGAGALYGRILQQQPDNVKAVAGMARCYLETGQPESARKLIETLPEAKRSDPDVASVQARLDLAERVQESAGRMQEYEARLQQNPKDHDARFELALAIYAQGQNERAIEELIEIVKRDRNWNDQAARKQLVKVFEALGPSHPATVEGRQKLSSVLFA